MYVIIRERRYALMSSTDDRDDGNFQDDFSEDDNFDYEKEIEAIEAQEREIEEERSRRKKEQDTVNNQDAPKKQDGSKKQNTAKKQDAAKKQDTAKKQQPAPVSGRQGGGKSKKRSDDDDWLGDIVDVNGNVVGKEKRHYWKPVVFIVIVIMIVVGAVGSWMQSREAREHVVEDFEAKVDAFEETYLDGMSLGMHMAYFENFMNQCREAIAAGDEDAIADLESRWSDMESVYVTVITGISTIDVFEEEYEGCFDLYYVTQDYEEEYDQLISDWDEMLDDLNYGQIDDITDRIESMLINLRSSDMSYIQTLKNEITAMDLDESYLSDEQIAQLEEYSESVQAYEDEENYAEAVSTLLTWIDKVSTLSEAVNTAKQAESESRLAAESESRAQAETETAAPAETESQTSQTGSSSGSTGSSSGTGTSSASDDYILPESSSRYLTDSDLKGLSSYELMIARNEIYARHGRKFKDSSLQAYFNSKSWYKGTVEADDFSTSVFNNYELANIDLIKSYEN